MLKYTDRQMIVFFQNKRFFVFALFGLALIFSFQACKSKPKMIADSGIEVVSQEGWLNDDTYQMWVYGEWDRERYFIEGQEEDEDSSRGKTAKSIFGLREDSKTAAKVKAMRNFKEKMLSEIESKTQVENSKLVSDVVESTLNGVIVAPQAVKEQYSERGDANVLFHFKADNLRNYIEKAIKQTIERYQEESP